MDKIGRLKKCLTRAVENNINYEQRAVDLIGALSYAVDLGYFAGFTYSKDGEDRGMWPILHIELPTGQCRWHMKAFPPSPDIKATSTNDMPLNDLYRIMYFGTLCDLQDSKNLTYIVGVKDEDIKPGKVTLQLIGKRLIEIPTIVALYDGLETAKFDRIKQFCNKY